MKCLPGGGESRGFCNNRNDPCQPEQGKSLHFPPDKLLEMICLMFKTSKKQIKQTSQTEKLPNKLKSDVERTFDGIFAHRFLKTYKYNYRFETFICFIRWLSMDCMTPEIVPASHAISRFSLRFCQNGFPVRYCQNTV